MTALQLHEQHLSITENLDAASLKFKLNNLKMIEILLATTFVYSKGIKKLTSILF